MDTGDRVQCHACGQVWPRNLHESLECPHCGSEFTEIIEIPPDTDPEPELPHADPPESFPSYRSTAPRPWEGHQPWAHPDDDEDLPGWSGGPGYQYTQRTYHSPGGNLRFSFQTHSLPPRRVPGVQREMGLDPTMRGLDSFFQSITEHNREHNARTEGPRSPRHETRSPPEHPFDDIYGAAQHRPAYHMPPAGLAPRDAEAPQPMDSPLRSLGDILELLHSNLENAQAGGPRGPGGPGTPGVRTMAGGTPLGALISAIISMERNSDAVYSQEELDRVISQLVEQNGNRSAAPPAPQDAIHALPKKLANTEMIGTDGGTECSICMDTVKVGDEVTMLPCTHWFHPQCIEMWLNQHNTCPHCRRGIDPTSSLNTTTTAPSEGTSDRSRRSDSLSRSSAHPSFGFDEEQGSRAQTSRAEGSGGWTGWVRSRLGGGG
ncbi:hypothetical protein BJX76DRAFT_48826 [Aspergillus varians]